MADDAEGGYWAARRGVGLMDRSGDGRLKMTGADSLDLLHRLGTQDLGALLPGQGAGTVLTTEKGRILDLLTVYSFPDHLLLLTSPDHQGAVLRWLDKYTIIEDSETADVTDATGLLFFFGPNASRLADEIAGRSLAGMPAWHHTEVTCDGMAAVLARGPAPAGDGFNLLLPDRAQAGKAARSLSVMGEALGLQPTSPEAYEALRIEAGMPAFGKELGERFNPLEARLRPFISFDKGCYIGQEVVARLDTYDKVQKLLVGLRLPRGAAPPVQVMLEADGKAVGFVTSAAFSPAFNATVALAYVRPAYARAGARIFVATPGGRVEAEVVDLPFWG